MLKVTKFQLPPPKRSGTVVKNILPSCPAPRQTGSNLQFLPQALDESITLPGTPLPESGVINMNCIIIDTTF